MFKLATKPTFKWPVKFKIIGDNGKYETVSFTATYKRLSQTEIEEMLERLKDSEQSYSDRSMCKDVVEHLDGIHDEDGNELDYDDSVLEMVLDVPGAAANIAKTFFEAIGGAREKN